MLNNITQAIKHILYGVAAENPINQFREVGAQLPAANCYFAVFPDETIAPE